MTILTPTSSRRGEFWLYELPLEEGLAATVENTGDISIMWTTRQEEGEPFFAAREGDAGTIQPGESAGFRKRVWLLSPELDFRDSKLVKLSGDYGEWEVTVRPARQFEAPGLRG